MPGKVYLVGAGPGDPELLTLKGVRALQEADAVVYDFLANPEFLDLAPPQAQRIYVGKKGGDHTMSQEDINRLIGDLAQEGKVVTRLKGGDPFVFGRGGEEASHLFSRGIPFEVVPGVTSAIAAPAYAGIPVTDRRCSTEVAFVTGHEDPTKAESTINWSALAGIGTLVFLMGIKNLPNIAKQLMLEGKPADTPAACVRWGTTTKQKSVFSTLAELPQAVQEAGIKPPAITIVGPVAGLQAELAWFEKLPLFGRRILNTRARRQASRLSQALKRLGAEVVEVPTIAIQPPSDPAPLKQAVRNLEDYDWLLFTSANGVDGFFAALGEAGKDVRALAGLKLGAIGPATAQAMSERGLLVDLTAKTFVAEGLLEALADESLEGKRVLLPRAKQARSVLPDTLMDWGAAVDVVPAYETVAPEGAGQALKAALDQGLDAITFSASSTVSNALALLDDAGKEQLRSLSAQGEIKIAAIGPITRDTAQEAGLTVHLMPEVYTIPALVDALVAFFQDT
jgi:uroporphyrinogen III methyltransferase/synthase